MFTKYDGWIYTVVPASPEFPKDTYDIKLPDGTDWYELMNELDELNGRWVIGIKDGFVNWATSGLVSGRAAPADGGMVIVTNTYPFKEDTFGVRYDGQSFFINKEVKRTIEDVEADLHKLLAEMQVMKQKEA